MARKHSMTFWQRLCYKYRVSFTNERLEEEEASYYVSRLGVAVWVIIISMILLLAGALLVVVTPIHKHLPGYTDESYREQVIRNSLQVDSLMDVMKKQDAYIENLRNVMAGTIPVDTACLNETILHRKKERILPVSVAEEDFRKSYESEQAALKAAAAKTSTKKK